MEAMRHSVAGKGKPYDYRVAYFYESVSRSSAGYFQLPGLPELMGLGTVSDDVFEGYKDQLKASDWEYGAVIGHEPGASSAGDRHIAGSVGWLFLGTYGGKWRPGGVGTWDPQGPVGNNIPMVGGVPVEIRLLPHGVEARDAAGHAVDADYTHQGPYNSRVFPVFRSDSNGTGYSALGARIYRIWLRNNISGHGFDVDYICVMKDGEPFIYDTVSGRFFPKHGGVLGVGPKVSDMYDPFA